MAGILCHFCSPIHAADAFAPLASDHIDVGPVFVASRDTVLLRQALTVRRDIRPPCAVLKPLPTCTPRLLPRGSPLAEPSAPGAVGLTPSVLHSAALGTPAIGFVELVDVVEGPCRTRLRPNDATRSYGQKAIMSSSTSTLQPCKPFLALESLEQDPSFPIPGRRLLGELRTSESCKSARDARARHCSGPIGLLATCFVKTLSHLERSAVSISDRAPLRSQFCQKVQRRAARDETGRVTNRTEDYLPKKCLPGCWRMEGRHWASVRPSLKALSRS